jgi:hypothetical protein
MTDAVGPAFAGGFQDIQQEDYKLQYLPDLHNDDLQREGKPPVYYWVPQTIRLAQKGNGDYKFSMVHFVGVRSGSTNVGASDSDEIAGGLVGFSTTAAPPAETMKKAEEQLLDRFRGSSDRYWGWRIPAAPMFRPAIITSCTTSLSNLGPGSGANPAVPAGGNGSGSRSARELSLPRVFDATKSVLPREFPLSGSVRRDAVPRDSNLDKWAVNLSGQGPGTINLLGENAFAGVLGSIPAALVWQSFHGGMVPIAVYQHMRMKVWSPAVHLRIKGKWESFQTHLSAAVSGRYLFASADIQVAFNNARKSGAIEVVVECDTTIPGWEEIQKSLDTRSNLVFTQFMEQAKKDIFEPASFQEQSAQASSGSGTPWGVGVAFKYRQDRRTVDLEFNETRQFAFLQDLDISGQLEGLYDELRANPEAERKYFMNLYLSEWERKVSRTVTPVVNWPDKARQWVGQPVYFLSAQVGYPNTSGVIQWDATRFDASGGPNAVWSTQTEQKAAADVQNPPAGWTPDKTFVKRTVHFTEPPNETEYPFARVSVEANEVDLDPEELGTLTDDINLEVRVDNVGMLNVGPIFLDIDLESAKEIVEVEFQAEGTKADGNSRAPVKMSWRFADQAEPRYWMIFTGQPDFMPSFRYRTRVVVKGSLTTKGQEWIGDWQDSSGNGELTVHVATLDEAVSSRAITISTASTRGAVEGDGAGPPEPATTAPAADTAPPEPGRGTDGPAEPARGTPSLLESEGWTMASPWSPTSAPGPARGRQEPAGAGARRGSAGTEGDRDPAEGDEVMFTSGTTVRPTS